METPTEEYFEPYCLWKRGKDQSDAIDIMLDGFKREDVEVKINRVGEKKTIISIIAESPRLLRKKIEISNDVYDIEHIRAVFCRGNLSLELPKKAASKKLEISKPSLEIGNFLQESAKDMGKKFSSAAENSFSKLIFGAFGFMLISVVLFAYTYYMVLKTRTPPAFPQICKCLC